jgi:hemerythrin superfamily protein
MSVTLENPKRSDQETTICDLIRLDHTKVNTLFGQIKATNEPQKLEEYSLYKRVLEKFDSSLLTMRLTIAADNSKMTF